MKRILPRISVLFLVFFLTSCTFMTKGEPLNVVFYSNGEVYSEVTVRAGKAMTPAAPQEEMPSGKVAFLFWSLESDPSTATAFDFSTPISSEMTFYAIWADCSVTYKNGDEVVHTDYTVRGKPVKAPDIQFNVPDGKEFTHWSLYDGGNEYDFESPVTSSIILHAVYKDKTFTVRFIDGVSDTERTVVYGGLVSKPLNPTVSGRIFKWWSVTQNGPAFDFSTAITSDLTLYAVWDVLTYTVVFDDGIGQTTQVVVAGERVKAPANPTGEGRTFRYWSRSKTGSPYDFSSPVNGAFTLYAVWEYEEYTVEFYSDGILFRTVTVKYGDMIPYPSTDPTMTGKTFSYWATAEGSSTAFDFKTSVTGNLKLYAVFKDIELTVTFNDNGVMSTNKVVYGNTLRKPSDPTMEGKRFLHWSRQQEGATAYDFTEPVTASFTLYAVYEDIELTVTYIVGDTRYEETVVYGGKAHDNRYSVPTDKTFTHWSTTADGPAYDFDTPVIKDLTLYAVLIDKMVMVTFSDGVNTTTQEVKYGTTALKPDNPVREGYVFQWWSKTENGKAFSFTEAIYGDLTLYAVWQDLMIHVTFMNGDSVYLVQDIDRGATATMPENPSDYPSDSSGHMFWSLEPGVKGAYDFATVPEDNITLHAVWMPKGIEINVKSTDVWVTNGIHAMGAVKLPYGITYIGPFAFDADSVSSVFVPQITSLELPASVKEISTDAFPDCESLKSITLNEGLEFVGPAAFKGTSITSLRIPGSLKVIRESAFAGMDKLSSVVLSEGVSSLLANSFANCDNLYSITIPTTLTNIDKDAFYHSGLDCVAYAEGTESIQSFFGLRNRDISTVIIPSTVKTIGSNVFTGCGKIKFQARMSSDEFTAIEGFPWGAEAGSTVSYI